MAILEFEASIESFLALGRELQSAQPLTAEHALNELIAWYRSSRIQDAELDQDGDMLLLQWGVCRPLKFTEPTDLRSLQPLDTTFFEPSSYRYIDLTRQVFASGSDPEVEFDDAAVQMSITLLYELSSNHQGGSALWIPTPADIEPSIREFHSAPFVKACVTEPCVRAVVSVGYCG